MDIDVFGIQLSAMKLTHSVVYLLFVLVCYLILRRILKTVFQKAEGKRIAAAQRNRLKTIHEMLQSVIRYIALILVLLTILANLGVNVTSLLAGLGIMTAVMGLAFQDLLKDVIAGVTIILEEQFSVGDTVDVDGFHGTVINMGLKTTQVQSSTGEVKIIANHNINNLVNYSKFDAQMQVFVTVPSEVEPLKVLAALVLVKKSLDGKVSELTSPIIINSVVEIDERGVKYALTCPCDAKDCSTVKGLVTRKIVEVFQDKRVEIAKPQLELRAKRSVARK